MNRIILFLLSFCAYYLTGCNSLSGSEFIERSVQVLDKDGNPVSHALVVKEESIGTNVFWIQPAAPTYTDEILVTDENGYCVFSEIPQKYNKRMTYHAFVPDGSYESFVVAERLNLKNDDFPFLRNTFDKKSNPNFIIYTDYKLLQTEDSYSRNFRVKERLEELRDEKFKKKNSKKEVDKLIEILEKNYVEQDN